MQYTALGNTVVYFGVLPQTTIKSLLMDLCHRPTRSVLHKQFTT